MSTHELYTIPAELSTWDVEMAGASRFTWEYDDGRDRLLALYQKGKDKQWDRPSASTGTSRSTRTTSSGMPDRVHRRSTARRCGTGSDDKQRQGARAGTSASWQFSQFLHGEQGAMICSARIVESVPDLDSKFYAATQTMDEARHAETYARFLQEKVGLVYPINEHLKALLDEHAAATRRWDMPYLGMQVLIEGLALAAFGVLRDMTTKPLPKQILAYVMQDEARHVAFGRMALRDYYARAHRGGAARARGVRRRGLLPDARPVPRPGGLGEPRPATSRSAMRLRRARPSTCRLFRSLLFSRIVPCVKDIGLWGDKVQKAYADMGVLDMAGVDLDALMKQDEDIAEELDAGALRRGGGRARRGGRRHRHAGRRRIAERTTHPAGASRVPPSGNAVAR